MQLSDDGQWMWNGTDWIPAGQPAVVQPAAAPVMPQPDFTGATFGAPAPASISMPHMNQPQVVYVQEEKSSKKIIPWIGVAVILLSLIMPYVSFFGIVEVSGLEMLGFIGEVAEAASEDSGDGGDVGSGDSSDDDFSLGSEGIALIIAAFVFVFSPLVFLLTSITSAILLLMKKSTKIVGIIHLSYVGIFFVAAILSPSLGELSIFSIIGFGFYLGAFSGGALLAK